MNSVAQEEQAAAGFTAKQYWKDKYNEIEQIPHGENNSKF